MSRPARNALIGLWVLLVGWSLLPRLVGLATAAREMRQGVDAEGDPVFDGAMARVAVMSRGEPAVLLVLDAPPDQREYLEFRASCDLFPVRPVVVFAARARTRQVSLTVPQREMMRVARVRRAAGWDRADGLRRLEIASPDAASRIRVSDAAAAMPERDAPGRPHRTRGALAVLALAALVLLVWRRLIEAEPSRHAPLAPVDRVGLGAVVLAVGIGLASALTPHGAWSTWDAWAVWDLKLKAILHEGWVPSGALADPAYRFAHPEYPLLWPWLQAILCRAAGTTDPWMLRLMSVAFAAALPPLFAGLLAELGVMRGRWAIAGSLALLPPVLDQSANGYVDWPLAVVETATMVLLLRARRGASTAWSVGLAAGLAANLKQEGMVFGLGVLGALGWRLWRTRDGWRAWGGAALAWLVLALPWRVVAWHLHLVPADFGTNVGGMLGTVPGRVGLFVRAFILEAFGPGLGGASFAAGTPVPWREWMDHVRHGWLLFWFVAAWMVVRRWRGLREPRRRDLLIILGAQALMAVVAYGATVRDPRWLLAASLDRLMLQWLPAVTALAASLGVADGVRRRNAAFTGPPSRVRPPGL